MLDGQIHGGLTKEKALGLIAEGDDWIVAPFRPSTTLDNLMAVPFATASHTDDVRVFAGCLTGRHDWPTVPADEIERLLDRVAKGADGYPPYNIERSDENRYRVTLAVAGELLDRGMDR